MLLIFFSHLFAPSLYSFLSKLSIIVCTSLTVMTGISTLPSWTAPSPLPKSSDIVKLLSSSEPDKANLFTALAIEVLTVFWSTLVPNAVFNSSKESLTVAGSSVPPNPFNIASKASTLPLTVSVLPLFASTVCCKASNAEASAFYL